MSMPKAMRTVLTLFAITTLAGFAGASHAQPLATADSAMQALESGNSPTVRMSFREAGPTVQGIVRTGRLIHTMTPIYPPAAIEAHISGVVTIEARIGKDGRVVDTNVISGPLALRRVAQYAVKRWRYEPTLLNGEPIEREAQIDLSFVLGHY